MTSPKPELSAQTDAQESSGKPSEASESQPSNSSATTPDDPSFGWSSYAERVNGRFAMIGFIAILIIEAFSNETFLHWAGLLS